MNTKIAIINPYFGKWPYWIDLYMQSCMYNSSIDFWFFTDCETPSIAIGSENLHFVQLSFGDYCKMASDKLGVEFYPEKPYKICDLRPFFGIVHEDILTNYDFWGFGDVDLVWGDLRSFCTDEILEKKDVFSSFACKIAGPFSLFRNTEYMRNQCFKIKDWKKKLTENQHWALDEIDFSVVLYGKILRLFWKIHRKVFMKLPFGDDWKMNTTFMNIMNVFFCPRKLYFVEQYATPWPEYIRHNKVNFKYEGGKTYNLLTGKEVMYLHFFSLKKVWKACDYVPKDGFNEVLFSASGILFK